MPLYGPGGTLLVVLGLTASHCRCSYMVILAVHFWPSSLHLGDKSCVGNKLLCSSRLPAQALVVSMHPAVAIQMRRNMPPCVNDAVWVLTQLTRWPADQPLSTQIGPLMIAEPQTQRGFFLSRMSRVTITHPKAALPAYELIVGGGSKAREQLL